MRSFLIVFTLAVGFAGCANPPRYGNYLPAPAPVDQTKLAGAAVHQLTRLWPPARTRLELQQPTPDDFGIALVAGLREKGYGVKEFEKRGGLFGNKPAVPESEPNAAGSADADAARLPLSYIVDRVGKYNLYRLTLVVGEESITRPYTARDDGMPMPAGYWSRQENGDE